MINDYPRIYWLQKRKAQETFLCSILQNKGRCWTEFYTYVKWHKGNRENISVIKDDNGKLITDSKEKSNSLNSYYVSISDANVIIHKFNQRNQVSPSPLY